MGLGTVRECRDGYTKQTVYPDGKTLDGLVDLCHCCILGMRRHLRQRLYAESNTYALAYTGALTNSYSCGVERFGT
jgi:hypothetical protein